MAETPIRLVAFDMEGCLTADPSVWELMHKKLGTWESHGLPYWNRFKAGEFEYDEVARMDVAAWRGAPAAVLEEASEEVSLMAGCGEVLAALSSAGVEVAIITNGLSCVADRFRRGFGVTRVFANRVLSEDGRLTGEIDIRVPYHNKGDVLRRLTAELGVDRDSIAAVGDTLADASMFRLARIGVAFRPFHPALADHATHLIRDGDLRALLPILLPAAFSRPVA